MIVAVIRSIAVPCERYTNARCLAAEMFLLIALIRFNGRTAELIGSIVTVGNSVALVGLLDALPKIGALELRRRTGYRRAVFLILKR